MRETEQSIEFYNKLAKQLYNLALYTLGDTALAQRTAIRAFCDTYERLGGIGDVRVCRRHCIRLLYTYGRKAWRKHRKICAAAHALCYQELPPGHGKKPLAALLDGLSYDSRFLLLLFCYCKLTIPEIAEAMGLPAFVVNRRLSSVSGRLAA